jgi:hypothetical protein
MSSHQGATMLQTSDPILLVPPLAGLASYAAAAQIGCGVDEAVARLLRCAWIEKRAMEVALHWLAPTPEWEIKEALGLHLHLDAQHVAALRARIGEMRSPAPRMDVTCDPALDCFFDELLTAQTSAEKIVGLYGVLKPALLAAYRQHCAAANPIADYPTRRMLKHILLDEEETAAWGEQAVAAVWQHAGAWQQAGAEAGLGAWVQHLEAFLAAAGGIMGDAPRPPAPPSRAAPFTPDFFPRRDSRFALRWTFVNPQRQVSLKEDVPLDERTLALMCRRIVEMDVPEYMTRIILLAADEPWEYYVDMTRQLWDEVRHAMLGTVYFAALGVDWKQLIAIHPGMSIRFLELDVQDAHNVLFAIEQKLMPGNSGKRLEYEISRNSGDPLAAQIQDYDWADEVLHVYIGRRWLLPKLNLKPNDAVERGWALRAATSDVLTHYEHLGDQVNWWPELVRRALGRETAVAVFDLTRL